MIKNEARRQNDSIIIRCNNKIRNNWIGSGEADIIRLDTRFSPAQTWRRIQKSQCRRFMYGLFVLCVIPPRSFHHGDDTVAKHPELSSRKVSFSVPSSGSEHLKPTLFSEDVLFFFFSRDVGYFSCPPGSQIIIPLAVSPQRWEQQMSNGRARRWKRSRSARQPWERCGIVDLAERFCLWVACGLHAVWFQPGGGFVCENVWERVCPVIKSACVENKWAWLNKENCFCPLACFVFSINTVFVAAPVSLASSFAILSVQIFRRRASLAARTLRRQPSSVASAINNDNMRTLSKSADLISQPGDSVDDGCTPGFRGPAVIWSRLFFRDLTKKTKNEWTKTLELSRSQFSWTAWEPPHKHEWRWPTFRLQPRPDPRAVGGENLAAGVLHPGRSICGICKKKTQRPACFWATYLSQGAARSSSSTILAARFPQQSCLSSGLC